MAVRLVLPVMPGDGRGTAREVLQVGAGHARGCLTYGLAGRSRRLPDRTINGVRFAAWSSGDAGMSQQISATDLRALVRNTCYAVARFSYVERARDRDTTVTLAQDAGARALDAALASLRLR